MPKAKLTSLDGSTLEGGGQLVRVALSLSAITGVPVHVFNIRANRASKGAFKSGGNSKGAQDCGDRRGTARNGSGGGNSSGSRKVEGGLKESHLAAMLWLADRCDAYVEGAEIGRREVTFIPGAGQGRGSGRKGGQKGAGLVDAKGDTIKLERPGSIGLILQCVLPYMLFGPGQSVPGRMISTTLMGDTNDTVSVPSKLPPSTSNTTATLSSDTPSLSAPPPPTPSTTTLTLHGGTNVDKAMSTDYLQHVFLPVLRQLIGPSLPTITLETIRRGWAGVASEVGEVKVTVTHHTAADDNGGGGFRIGNITAMDRGDIERLSAVIIADGEQLRTDILRLLNIELAAFFDSSVPVDLLTSEDSHDPRRLYILLIAHTSGGYRLGHDVLGSGRRPRNNAEQGKIVEGCVRGVVRGLNGEIRGGGCVDSFMADQVVVFQGLGRGVGRVDGGGVGEGTDRGIIEGKRVSEGGDEEVIAGDQGGSLHARTVRWVCERMLRGLGGVEFKEGGWCRGAGWGWDGDEQGNEEKSGTRQT